MGTQRLSARVCIVGGGPAGMMLGLLLARAGVETLVLEKHADFMRDFRGDTLHPSTLEVLKDLGLLDRLLALPHQEASTLEAEIGGRTYPVADFSRLPATCRFIAFMPQWGFLNFLAGEAAREPAFTLRMSTEASGLLERGGKVAGVRARGPEGPLEIEADLVIGADGRDSTIRDQAGLPLRRIGAPMDVLWCRLPRLPGDPGRTGLRLDAGRLLVRINRGDYWQCGLVVAKDEGGARRWDLDSAREALALSVPYARARVEALRDEDFKTLSVRVEHLERWWRPGLLCIGDAAHAMSPVGGVGINLAVQDAVAAANILAEPARSGRLSFRHLRRVQRRRRWPARVFQRLQMILHRRVVARALAATGELAPPLTLRLLTRWPLLRRIPGRLIGLGVRPEHPGPRFRKLRSKPSPGSAWRLGGLSPAELARRVWRQVGRDELHNRAAGLSFYFLISLFPLLIFMTALFGLLSAPGFMNDLLGYFDRVLPNDAASLLRKTFQEVATGAGGGFASAGLAGSLWFASSGMVSIIKALNAAFGIAEPRSWPRRRLTALGLTAGFSLLVLTSLLLVAFGGMIGVRVADYAGLGGLFRSAWEVFRWTAGPLAALAGVGLVYRLAPPGRRGRPLLSPGAVFAVLAWLGASHGLSAYASGSTRYNAVYGSIGAVVVLLLWLYLSAFTLLVGAEIDAEIERASSS